MKLLYITNATIPSERAHSLQIMKACEAFAVSGIETKLILPTKRDLIKKDPFDYYGVKKNFSIVKVPSLDLIWLLPERLGFYINALTFAFSAAIYTFSHYKKGNILYSRDYATLALFCLLGFSPVAEIHDYRSRKPKKLINLILKRSKRVIVNSEGTKSLISGHYKIDKDIMVAPNGVDIDFFNVKKTKEEAREILGIPQDKKVIAYIGSLATAGTEKGVWLLIKAFDLVKDERAVLYVIGGPNGVSKEYELQARKAGLTQEKAIFTGYVEYLRMPLYVRAIDVAVIPLPINRHSETTSPIKIFELMAAGKPIVISDLSAARSILGSDGAVYFEPENSNDLAAKIEQLLGKPEIMEKLSANVGKLAQKYTWQARAQQIVEWIY